MGFSPRDLDRWEPYQFTAAFFAWRAANCAPDEARAPSAEEFRAAVARTVH